MMHCSILAKGEMGPGRGGEKGNFARTVCLCLSILWALKPEYRSWLRNLASSCTLEYKTNGSERYKKTRNLLVSTSWQYRVGTCWGVVNASSKERWVSVSGKCYSIATVAPHQNAAGKPAHLGNS